METIKLKTRIGSDGLLKLETPTHFKDIETEVVIVLQPLTAPNVLGWPTDYFEAIDAIQADDIVERPEQGALEVRESLE